MDTLIKHYEAVRELGAATHILLTTLEKNEAECLPDPVFVEELKCIKQLAVDYLLEACGYQVWVDAPLMSAFAYFSMLASEHADILEPAFSTFKAGYAELIKSW